jgi:hypothetical protein
MRLIDAGARHVDRHVEGAGEAERVGAAMAFHHDAVEAEEYAAIGGARIELAPQRVQRAAREEGADAPSSERVSALRRKPAPPAWPCLPRS